LCGGYSKYSTLSGPPKGLSEAHKCGIPFSNLKIKPDKRKFFLLIRCHIGSFGCVVFEEQDLAKPEGAFLELRRFMASLVDTVKEATLNEVTGPPRSGIETFWGDMVSQKVNFS
jgi:hypothetical protein